MADEKYINTHPLNLPHLVQVCEEVPQLKWTAKRFVDKFELRDDNWSEIYVDSGVLEFVSQFNPPTVISILRRLGEAEERMKELESWIDKGESPMLRTAREQLAAAEADNAALVKVLDEIRKKSYEPDPELPALSTRHEIQLIAEGVLVGPPHPGTTLTQRLAGMEAICQDFVKWALTVDSTTAHYKPDTTTLGDLISRAQQALEGK